MQIKILNEKAIPHYATAGSAAFDLKAVIDETISIIPGEKTFIQTGIAVYIEHANLAGLILPRSGLGSKGIRLGNTIGLIDSDYQGEIIVVLENASREIFWLHPFDRVAQMMIVPVIQTQFEIVEEFSQNTFRGTGGFGSTG